MIKNIANLKNIFSDVVATNLDHNDLVVFSHLRWHFVTQRPQHIINRMAAKRKVLFIEEPIFSDSSNHGTVNVIKESNITVLQPRISNEHLISELTPIVRFYIDELDLKDPMFWFYSPAFVDILNFVDHSAVIYDCMDELSNFKGASQSLISQEKVLLKRADIVFTGGKSLYESKSKHNDNVFCFPSSVDQKHFTTGLSKKKKAPMDISSIAHPIVGYYGVIDERIDLSLLKDIADKLPEISFVMIGPVVKIEEQDLPRRSNIHYLGAKDYSELPQYLKEFDVCMMPFALNKSTKYISPTKTLEYMVALKPIISTPIHDVVRDYSSEVKIIDNAESFSKAINYYLKETSLQKRLRHDFQKAVLARTSWDSTVKSMNTLIKETILQRNSEITDPLPSGSFALN